MSADGGLRKARDLAERDPDGFNNGFGEPTQAGADDDSNLGLLIGRALPYCSCRFDRGVGLVFSLHSSVPISSSILSDACSISTTRPSHGRNALSNPLSAIPASSSTVKPRCSAA